MGGGTYCPDCQDHGLPAMPVNIQCPGCHTTVPAPCGGGGTSSACGAGGGPGATKAATAGWAGGCTITWVSRAGGTLTQAPSPVRAEISAAVGTMRGISPSNQPCQWPSTQT